MIKYSLLSMIKNESSKIILTFVFFNLKIKRNPD